MSEYPYASRPSSYSWLCWIGADSRYGYFVSSSRVASGNPSVFFHPVHRADADSHHCALPSPPEPSPRPADDGAAAGAAATGSGSRTRWGGGSYFGGGTRSAFLDGGWRGCGGATAGSRPLKGAGAGPRALSPPPPAAAAAAARE